MFESAMKQGNAAGTISLERLALFERFHEFFQIYARDIWLEQVKTAKRKARQIDREGNDVNHDLPRGEDPKWRKEYSRRYLEKNRDKITERQRMHDSRNMAMYRTQGQIFRQMRKDAGLSQEELGKRLGVKKAAISKRETGRAWIDPQLYMEQIRRVIGAREEEGG